MNNKYQDFINKLYELRQSSIEKEGEFGVGNLVFKEFRNKGYLDNLKELSKKETSKTLTLESYKNDSQIGEYPFIFERKDKDTQIWYVIKTIFNVMFIKELKFTNKPSIKNVVLIYLPPITNDTILNCGMFGPDEVNSLSKERLEEFYTKLKDTFFEVFDVEIYPYNRYLLKDISLEVDSKEAQEFLELVSSLLLKIYKEVVE